MARYNENFPRMLAYVERALLDPGLDACWFPDSGAPNSVVNPRHSGVRRILLPDAVYSALVGGLKEHQRPVASCGNSWCVNPLHQEVVFSGRPDAIPDLRDDVDSWAKNYPRLAEFGFPRREAADLPK